MTADVTIVIPNFNGKDCLEECLDSIYAGTLVPEVIVVDNGSSDGSDEAAAVKFPDAKFLKLKANTGFCHAVNTGIHATRTPYVILLNNDVVVDRECVEKLRDAVAVSDKLFSVQAMMLSMRDRSIVDDGGDWLDLFGYAFARSKGKRFDAGSLSGKNKTVQVFTACAGAAIYRMSVFDEIGLFDERHFCYLEDVDIGWRARIFGYRNICRRDAVVYHRGSASSGSVYNPFKQEMTAGNSLYIQYKNMPALQYALNYPAMAAGRYIKKRFFEQKGLGEAYNKGLTRGRNIIEGARNQMYLEKNDLAGCKTDLAVSAAISEGSTLKDTAGLKGFNTLYTGTKVPFTWRNLPYYFLIQILMLKGTFLRIGSGLKQDE